MTDNKKQNCLIYTSANHTDIIVKNLKVSKSDVFEISDVISPLTEDFTAKYDRMFFCFR